MYKFLISQLWWAYLASLIWWKYQTTIFRILKKILLARGGVKVGTDPEIWVPLHYAPQLPELLELGGGVAYVDRSDPAPNEPSAMLTFDLAVASYAQICPHFSRIEKFNFSCFLPIYLP